MKRSTIFSSSQTSLGAIALALVIILLMLRLLAPNLFWKIFTQVFRISDAVSEKNHAFLNSFKDTSDLALQNSKLINDNETLLNENRALVQRIGAFPNDSSNINGIVAWLITRPPTSPYDILVLSSGSENGVSVGMEVFGKGEVPLGIISSVSENFSRATLFSSPGMIINGWIGRDSLPLIVKGDGGGAMSASIARSANVEVGDIVFAPGPGMLPIGSVVRVDSDPTSISVVLRIMPTINLFSLSWVTLRNTGL